MNDFGILPVDADDLFVGFGRVLVGGFWLRGVVFTVKICVFFFKVLAVLVDPFIHPMG